MFRLWQRDALCLSSRPGPQQEKFRRDAELDVELMHSEVTSDSLSAPLPFGLPKSRGRQWRGSPRQEGADGDTVLAAASRLKWCLEDLSREISRRRKRTAQALLAGPQPAHASAETI